MKIVEKSSKIRKIWKIPFCGVKICKKEPGSFLGRRFWPPIWKAKSMKIRKNASQKPSEFEAFSERAPGGAFGALLGVPELENEGKSMIFESKSVPKGLFFFVFLVWFFQTFLLDFFVWLRFSRCERFLQNVPGTMVFTMFSAHSHFVQTLFFQSFPFKFASGFRLISVLIFIEKIVKIK